MSNSLFSDFREPIVSLYDFRKLIDVSDRKEIKNLLEDKIKYLSLIQKYKEDSELNFSKLIEELPSHLKKNKFIRKIEKLPWHSVENGFLCSISGGYPRNILMGTEKYKTDLDIVTFQTFSSSNAFSFLYEQVENGNKNVSTFNIENNTMHLLNSGFPVFDSFKKNKLKHVFVDPFHFDFTINLASISSTDGYIYAPPITIHDIQNKIIRPTGLLSENFCISSLIDISRCIRAIRFALKYDMTIHNYMYLAIKALFSLQNERKTIDDKGMYYALTHILDDPESLQEEFYSTLRKFKVFETNNFITFKEYFNYIKKRKECDAREGRIVGLSRSLLY